MTPLQTFNAAISAYEQLPDPTAFPGYHDLTHFAYEWREVIREAIAKVEAGQISTINSKTTQPTQMPNITTKSPHLKLAISVLIEALKNDPDYRRAWKDNLAVAYTKAYENAEMMDSEWDIANAAAYLFLDTLTKIEVK